MLYVNKEFLDTSNRSKDYKLKDHVEDYHQKVQYLRDYYGDKVRLLSTRRDRFDQNIAQGKPIPTLSMRFESVTYNDKTSSSEDWVYANQFINFSINADKLSYPRTKMIKGGEETINIQKDPDFAYFVIYKSGQVGEGQYSGRKFYIDDRRKAAKQSAITRKREGNLSHLIYDQLDEKKAMILAKSYGVSNVNGISDEERRNALYDIVMANENKLLKRPELNVRGIDAFMRDSDMDLRTKIGALVQDSIDKDVLIYNIVDRRWEIDYNDGRTNYVLMEVSSGDSSRHREVMIEYLTDNKDALHRLQGAMGEDGMVSVGITLDDILKENNPPKLRKIAKEHCSLNPSNKTTKDQLKWDIVCALYDKQTAMDALGDNPHNKQEETDE